MCFNELIPTYCFLPITRLGGMQLSAATSPRGAVSAPARRIGALPAASTAPGVSVSHSSSGGRRSGVPAAGAADQQAESPS